MLSKKVSYNIMLWNVLDKRILTFLSGPIQIPYISNTIMWKVMIKDISKSQKLDRELSLLELTSLMQDDKNSSPWNSTTHMYLGKPSNSTVTSCQGEQAKVDRIPGSSIEVDIRTVVVAVILSSIGALTVIALTLWYIKRMIEDLVMIAIAIMRFLFVVLS